MVFLPFPFQINRKIYLSTQFISLNTFTWKNGWASPSIAWQKVQTNKNFRSQWAFLMSQSVDSWQSESLFPRSWDILLLKMLFLECRGSRMLFYAIFWRYVLSNTAVGWQHKQVSGTDWRSAQPLRKCDIALFLGKQKWLLGKLSVHEIFCNIDLFSFLLTSNHQIVDKKKLLLNFL